MNLLLFGFKGCGKTYFGKKLAEKLSSPFVDTDDLILRLYTQETQESLSIRDLYRKIGEDTFRSLEKRALSELVNLSGTIIALGGGAILDPENRETLQKIGKMIYLQAGTQLLRQRMLLKELPSFLKDKESFESMYRRRLPIYESIDATCIDVEHLDEAIALSRLCEIYRASC